MAMACLGTFCHSSKESLICYILPAPPTATSKQPDVKKDHLLSIIRAILQTITYADVFDYPLTALEIHRYLTSQTASLEEVTRALEEIDTITCLNDYYVLSGRECLIATRQRRAGISSRLWIKAKRYGQIISLVPFIRMVAVTGSLAMNNTDEDKDIDYMLVTAPGWLWTCRALSLLVVRIAKLGGVTLCPNYLVTENALVLSDRSLYVAHELAQMIPLSGMETYAELRRLNSWTDEYLPNAQDALISLVPERTVALIQRIAEWLFIGFRLQWFERWEMNRKVARLGREQAASPEAGFSADVCKGHADKHGQKTELAIRDKLKQTALEY
jgi:hypothetical protein